jgi:hypothetical protein
MVYRAMYTCRGRPLAMREGSEEDKWFMAPPTGNVPIGGEMNP